MLLKGPGAGQPPGPGAQATFVGLGDGGQGLSCPSHDASSFGAGSTIATSLRVEIMWNGLLGALETDFIRL
jgi:hypothetical protein